VPAKLQPSVGRNMFVEPFGVGAQSRLPFFQLHSIRECLLDANG